MQFISEESLEELLHLLAQIGITKRELAEILNQNYLSLQRALHRRRLKFTALNKIISTFWDIYLGHDRIEGITEVRQSEIVDAIDNYERANGCKFDTVVEQIMKLSRKIVA